MANAPMIGLGHTGADFMIGTTTDAIHAHCARRTRYRVATTKPCRSARRATLKVCTPICRNGSDGRPSRLALMPLGAGIRERCARDRSPPGPRRREAARFTRARRAGSPARAPYVMDNIRRMVPAFSHDERRFRLPFLAGLCRYPITRFQAANMGPEPFGLRACAPRIPKLRVGHGNEFRSASTY